MTGEKFFGESRNFISGKFENLSKIQRSVVHFETSENDSEVPKESLKVQQIYRKSL